VYPIKNLTKVLYQFVPSKPVLELPMLAGERRFIALRLCCFAICFVAQADGSRPCRYISSYNRRSASPITPNSAKISRANSTAPSPLAEITPLSRMTKVSIYNPLCRQSQVDFRAGTDDASWIKLKPHRIPLAPHLTQLDGSERGPSRVEMRPRSLLFIKMTGGELTRRDGG
jgi:hypothetical protein